MSSRVRWLILACAVVGLGFAGAAAWVHYRLLTDPTYVSPCDVNATFSCSEAYLSRYGSVAGIPVALGGVLWFGVVALLAAFARTSDEGHAPSVAAGYIFGASLVGLVSIAYFAYASFAILHHACLLCMGTYVSVLAIFGLTFLTNRVGLGTLAGRVFGDLAALGNRTATLVAAVVLVGGVAFAATRYPKEAGAAAATSTTTAPADARAAFAEAWAKQPRRDLGVPADGAKVVIVKFNDFECPTCRVAETYYGPIIAKFNETHPGAVKYVMKDWPWNSACNVGVRTTFIGHEAACAAVAAARMARDRGKFDAMEAWLFANQGTTPEKVKDAAATILGVTDFDREYAEKLPQIRQDVADGMALQIHATPTFFINGVELPSDRLVAPEYFELAIELELQRAG
ncbi:MAG TPA: vitamin K epoxide reductase family protein [Vicinamibacterales bacterium]|jgi:uncharacterized membrane protein/protein-disulfide isomerase|nr:vitamin K epoxide reductase family protein [Vicinamibacterales bacterium]